MRPTGIRQFLDFPTAPFSYMPNVNTSMYQTQTPATEIQAEKDASEKQIIHPETPWF